MKLDVLAAGEPWYSDGLRFTCTQCGNCCTGGPGYVWISDEEVARLAAFLKMPAGDVLSKYCRKVGGRLSLKERRTPSGNYDCIFLQEIPPPAGIQSKQLDAGQPVPQKRRGCAIYPVRPLQCRTWPFWKSNLSDDEAWNRSSRRCPGMGQGERTFTREQIESLRDAPDWPENPPGSQKSR